MTDTRSGISWVIEGNVQHGVYLLGEPWFVPDPAFPTPRIFSVTPATYVDTNGRTRNGSMKNVRGNSVGLAYDSDMIHDLSRWAPSLLVDYSTVTMSPGDVLVSTESNPSRSTGSTCGNCSVNNGWRCYLTVYDYYVGASSSNCTGGASPTKKAAVLTCLAGRPPETATGQPKAFRPPYACNPSQPRPFSNRLAVGGGLVEEHLTLDTLQGQRALLPGLTPGFAGPTAQGLVPFFDRVWLDHTNIWAEDLINPTDHMPGYGGNLAKIVSLAALVLMESRPNEAAHWESLLRGMLQVGIDTYGLYRDGGDFLGGGGKRAGRKFPMFFAGIMLQRPEMSVPGDFSFPPDGPYSANNGKAFLFRFKEDDQVYVDGLLPPPNTGIGLSNFRPDWQGSKWKWCSTHQYGGVNIHFNDSAPDEVTPRYPGDWDQAGAPTYPSWQYDHWNNESYRFCCTSPNWVGFNLAARMLPGGIPAWQNEAFFGYLDRYMLPISDEACTKYDTIPGFTAHRNAQASSSANRSADEEYVLNMWRTYRWAHNQQGVVAVYPQGFTGTEFDCNDATSVADTACQVPGVARKRRYPVLVCEDRPVVGAGVYAEVLDIPTNGILAYIVSLAGPGSASPVRLFPGECQCVPAQQLAASLCGGPVFGNMAALGTPGTEVLSLSFIHYSFSRLYMPIPQAASSVNLEWVLQGIVFNGATASTTNAYHFRNLPL